MNSSSKLILCFVLVAMVTLCDSCTKVREGTFIKGLWELESIHVDTLSENQMKYLPYYSDTSNCCNYRVDFQDNDIVFGYYLTYDTFNYITVGSWHLNDYNHMDLQLDNYIDGSFKLEKTGLSEFTLTSDANHIKAFETLNPALDTAKTVLIIKRQ